MVACCTDRPSIALHMTGCPRLAERTYLRLCFVLALVFFVIGQLESGVLMATFATVGIPAKAKKS